MDFPSFAKVLFFLEYWRIQRGNLSEQREVYATITPMFKEVGVSGEIIILTMFKDK